ncbi:hypothetical protein BT96DRAFT_913524 [Gymnopus androsaceus JB14]|uniref:BTB domain-containing protein n=1 Tax=Gymnopus androsaceus JB14 TaxID=1447944 RepID=A0A6A4ILN2_9AGAR|nr:hypothetical protein BT96DRAFT_913524 [Gymnopus androsaceus JB14]
MNSSDIQSHLYNSFLTGETSDVCIRISGAFNAVYKLHRVVLIQAGFWRDLFTGGFIESSLKRKTSFNEEVFDVVLEDRNVTRAAFELATSRLYGGGPPLYIHPSILPTSTRPMTPGYPCAPPLSLSSPLLYPPGHQPAAPEFLLSLLATSLLMEAVLRTIGPRTVEIYLNFALGKTKVGDPDRPAVGLEGLAHNSKEKDGKSDTASFQSSTANDDIADLYSPSSPSSVSDESLVLSVSHTESNKDWRSGKETVLPKFHYGPVSDKIGEACACWLAKWGGDMFAEEKKVVLDWLSDANASLDSFEAEQRAMEGLPLLSATSSNTVGLPTSSSAWSPKWTPSKEKSIPRLFTGTAMDTRREGLSSAWIHALISSDGFFVPSPSLYTSHPITSSTSPLPSPNASKATQGLSSYPEEERYEFAKRVVELRRAVRVKIRQLRRKQMAADAEREDNEHWDTLVEQVSQRREGKGKERARNIVDLNESIDEGSATDRDIDCGSRWKLWSEVWKKECEEENAQWDAFFKTVHILQQHGTRRFLKLNGQVMAHSFLILTVDRDRFPYVNLRTLQEAAWEAGIVSFAISGRSLNIPLFGEKLGFAKTVSDTLSSLTGSALHDMKPYFAISTDESLRIGDTVTASSGFTNTEGNIHNGLTMDELFANSFGGGYLYRGEHSKGRLSRPDMIGRASTSVLPDSSVTEKHTEEPEKTVFRGKTSNENSFFGLLGNSYYPIQTKDSDIPSFNLFPLHSSHLSPSQLLSPHPPLRFNIEFFNLEMLKEKERLTSRTVWFAGSLWNVYVQIVKRKEKAGTTTPGGAQTSAWAGTPGSGLLPNHQLGVYLQRQSPTENLTPFSAPDPFADTRWSSRSIHDSRASTQNAPRSSTTSSSPNQASRGPAFSPLTPYASAPQVSSTSVTVLRSPLITSPGSRFRGNSTSATTSPSARPVTAPGSPSSPSASNSRPRTPGGSGGWRSLAPSSPSASSGLLSSSLPSVFPTFGRTRHQSSGSNRRDIEYGIPVYLPPSSPSSAVTPTVPQISTSSSRTEPSLPNPPFQAIPQSKPIYPYLDPRPVVSVYFSVLCASPTGSAQTQFRSAPDVFKVGQSWGWKSSGLVGGPNGGSNRKVSNANGDFEAALIEMDDDLLPMGHEVSLRATVVLGLV